MEWVIVFLIMAIGGVNMKNYKLPNGTELGPEEMSDIHRYYEIQCTADYLIENHKVPEDEAEEKAEEVRRMMDKYGFTEEEAIDEIL